MSSELKIITDQLKKLNQNIERYLRMIDPTLHPIPLQKVKGIIEIDPAKKYLIVFNDDVPVKIAYELRDQIQEYLPEINGFFLGGDVLKDIEVKE